MQQKKRTQQLNTDKFVHLRESKGWTQDKLAVKAKVSKRTIERLEQGQPIFANTASKLAECLGVPLNDLLVQSSPDRPRDPERERLLKNVRITWLKRYPEKVGEFGQIPLWFEERPELVKDPWDGILPHSSTGRRQQISFASLRRIFADLSDAVLILGSPGAGKSTTMLRLLTYLLDEAEQSDARPIPVVCYLSSWTMLRQPLAEWLVDELNRYGVPINLGKRWVEDGHILPLLDGLDRVPEKHRAHCVNAINEFRAAQRRRHGATPMVVCSGLEEYDHLPVRLELKVALKVLPLTAEQIRKHLDSAGSEGSALRNALESDSTLWDLLDTPLMLDIFSCIYKEQLTEPIPTTGSLDERRARAFLLCAKRLFDRKVPGAYNFDSCMYWLARLARLLQRNSQTIFHLERIQPDWLPLRSHQQFVVLGALLTSGMMVGLVFGVGAQLSFQQQSAVLSGINFGFFGPLLFWIFGYGRTIRPSETLSWSLSTLLDRPGKRYFGGLLFAAIFGLFGYAVQGPDFGALLAVISGIMFLVFFEIPGLKVETLKVPNEGIRRSLVSGILSGLIAGFVSGVLFWGAFGPPAGIAVALGLGLVMGLLNGGHTCIQHGLLRVILIYNGFAPWHYVRFLDYAAERTFLKKVGSGYMFGNPLFSEYFAALDVAEQSRGEQT